MKIGGKRYQVLTLNIKGKLEKNFCHGKTD